MVDFETLLVTGALVVGGALAISGVAGGDVEQDTTEETVGGAPDPYPGPTPGDTGSSGTSVAERVVRNIPDPSMRGERLHHLETTNEGRNESIDDPEPDPPTPGIVPGEPSSSGTTVAERVQMNIPTL